MKSYSFETLQVHAGYEAEKTTGAHVVPIYATNAYVFDDAQDAALQFDLKKPGSIYSRIGNPTVAALEGRIAALEKGVGTVCFASGMAAIIAAIQNLAECGSEVIALSTIYGGTNTLLFQRFEQRYGIKAHSIDPEDMEGLKAAINPKTRCIYFETLGNPNANIPEIEEIVAIARENGLPVIADNTFGTPYLIDCKELGIDFIVHSLTKYMCGHGNAMGGSVTDLGTFSFAGNPRFKEFNEPDEAYHGLVYADLGEQGYLAKLRAGFLRDTGACLSPFSAFLIQQGIQTLSLRMNKHCENAQKIAEHLLTHECVEWVSFPGLEGDRYNERAKKYFNGGVGGIFTFGIKGGVETGRKFIDALELFTLVANVSDVRSLVTHPASTTHSQLTEEQMLASGIRPELIRLSVGIEDVNDLIADLNQALIASSK